MSDVIEILIGLDEARYLVHKDVICPASPFFERCLQHDMKESSTKTVRLPEDDPQAFAVILEWVYDRGRPVVKGGSRQVRRMVQAYQLADKLCMESLTNSTADAVKTYHVANLSYACVVVGLPAVPIKDFLMDQLAYDISRGDMWTDPKAKTDPKEFFISGTSEVAHVMERSGLFAMDLRRDKKLKDSSPEPDCKYHKHLDSEKCKGYEPKK